MRSFCLFFLLATFLLCLAVGGWFAAYVFTPSPGTEKRIVDIPKGAGVRQIQSLLALKEIIIADDIRFLTLARLFHVLDHPPRLRAGEFEVPQGLTPLEVIRFLDTAQPVRHRVTVPEGKRMTEIAAIFAEDGWADPAVFIHLCQDAAFLKELGVTAASLEGYLFPETYTLVRGEIDERKLIRMMVERFFAVWQELTGPETAQRTDQVGKYNQHQLLILASIVEKETGSAGERDVIAGVFYNRLKKGMRLQSDPTTIYGIENFNGNLTKADLERWSPYNTYVIPGLPAGPICNPGAAALQAVLQPANVPYLYFVSQNDGSHYFSKSLQEHNRAVYKYQKLRKKR
ncbi:MAG: endolytic transglycosylase MltG [Candidatus Electrothrix aestuarii]|uniref:Endolytic murein transglycosylase n=1 Tax=Candidatus Electrothrix aestuarii TaxID=3062594 RepID=A0AAU8M1B6_9BACT|nr:endolytic transglycosylase MltG [Candidatus Electrothrix aestuarii]